MPRGFTRSRLIASAAVLTAAAGTAVALNMHLGVAATPASASSREQLAKALLDNGRARFATQGALRALEYTAGLTGSPGRQLGEPGDRLAATRPATGGAAALPRAGLPNVRVNNPAEDHFQPDQTTQSETSLAVAGSNVAVGFNDSQQALFTLTDGFDFSGYAYSTDGGATFKDGGTLPNPLNFVNFGDPWLTSDRAGRMYYSTLTYGGNVGNLEIAVSRSNNGGRTWSEPTFASPNDDNIFYQGDKDAIVAGRDPNVASRDNLYATWDDFTFDFDTGAAVNGLPVATSTDHGAHWSLHYADKITSDPSGCSFGQYIGAQPLVNPANGTLFVAAEKIEVRDPHCNGGTEKFSEVLFRSHDAGATFSKPIVISSVTPAASTGALELGPGMFVRTIEFPSLAMRNGTLWAAWNDGRSGRSHIMLATSTDRGTTWSVSSVTSGTGDEIQPALSADSAGLHVAYYQRNADNTLDTVVADSTDNGIHFTTSAVTSRSFPGVVTIPQFDPQIAFGYMGDYITNVSDGTHQYFAWGDNRDQITDFTHPQGRHDPDVFFARR